MIDQPLDNVAGDQDVPADIEAPQVPQYEIEDTSTADFFYGEKQAEGGDDNLIGDNVQTPPPADDSTPSDVGDVEVPEGAYQGNNQYLSALDDWARQTGTDIDISQFDEENFNEDNMRFVVGRAQAMTHLEATDKTLHEIVSRGLNVDQYLNERMQYQGLLAKDDATLFKGQMYEFLKGKNQQMGVLQVNEQGQITQESHQAIMDEIEKHTSNMTPEQFKAKADAIRTQINQHINQIPEHLKQRYKEQYEQDLTRYKEDVNNIVEGFKEKVNKSKSMVIGFADQSARDGFKDFIEKQLTPTEMEVNGEKTTVSPLFHELQNNGEKLLQVLRLMHLADNGYFTDVQNKAKSDAFKNLGLLPGGKKTGGKKPGNRTRNGIAIENTHTKEFFEGN